MLELNKIIKKYITGDNEVVALNEVDLKFRKNEFVSILGPSGCGKTTMLNIIGGLDRYTDGDLVINGVSTKTFKDRDWDTYRNHSIGFVFQSYNLIPHQSVLSNVELALTLSGVSKAERRARAKEALQKVGLGDQLHKRPSQMSGGQMQRVAIARALVNDPDILLADEPTGALDTATSVQIMDLLKEVASDRLVIMVTHNPELAEEYSTRIVRLSDGRVIDDTDPFDGEETAVEAATATEIVGETEVKEVTEEPVETDAEETESKPVKKKKSKKSGKRTSMSFFTAVSLSTNNLLTKKGRTILTSFAGSIGIIGIALILSLSTGIQAYIDQIQEDTLSSYPLSINKTVSTAQSMMQSMSGTNAEGEDAEEEVRDENKIYVDDSMGTMVQAMMSTADNDLERFKKYIDENYIEIADSLSAIQYTYDMEMQVFTADGKTQVNPTTLFDNMGDMFSGVGDMISGMGGFSVMSEMIDNQKLLEQQYQLVDGDWPKEETDIVLVVSKDNQISLMTVYMLGELDQSGLDEVISSLMPGPNGEGGKYESPDVGPFEFSHFIGKEYVLFTTEDFYDESEDTYTVNGKTYPVWKDVRKEPTYDQEAFVTNPKNGIKVKISGIIKQREGVSASSISTPLAYTKGLTDLMLRMNAESKILNQQKETKDYNVLTGLRFERTYYTPDNIDELIKKIDKTTMEQYFYPFVTDMILNGQESTDPNAPSFKDMLNVKDKDSFLGVYMLLESDYQKLCVQKMIDSAKVNNPMGLNMLCAQLTEQLNGIVVTPDTFVRLMDVMEKESPNIVMGLMYGADTPMGNMGLISFAGEETMNKIYAQTSEELKTMEVNEEIFTRLLQNAGMFIPDFATSDTFKQLEEMLYSLAPGIDASYKSNIELLDDAEKAKPASINFYAKDFESKDNIEAFIKKYNDKIEANYPGEANATKREQLKIKYTDVVKSLMSGVSLIINVISYVLIAFVSISLVVSSIMIGIITYISVLERTKEIGILRAIGASKKDISRVFNAETLIVGFASGFLGIASTLLMLIPINALIHWLTKIPTLNAQLPLAGALILVGISMVLTFVAGLIPSRLASKKDPVEALRSE